MNKGLSTVGGLLIALLVAAVAGVGVWTYYTLTTADITNSSGSDVTVNTGKTSTENAATKDWKTYTNDTYKFSVKYPSDLLYQAINNGKNIIFQTAKQKSDYEACLKTNNPECTQGFKVSVGIDEMVGATNGDNIKLTLEEIIQNRVKNSGLDKDPQKIALDEQPAYEGTENGMFAFYKIISKYNNHIYALTIECETPDATGTATLKSCKDALTSIQKNMISTFKFTK